MASRNTRRKNLTQFLMLAVAAIVVIAASIAFQSWWNARPATPPNEVSITASAGDQRLEVYPYSICEPGVPCEEQTVPEITVQSDEEITLDIPEEIHDHDWALLKIYDDPAANDDEYHRSYDTTTVTIPASVDPLEDDGERPKLVVVEVSSVLIGTDDEGEESPYTVTWSLKANVN